MMEMGNLNKRGDINEQNAINKKQKQIASTVLPYEKRPKDKKKKKGEEGSSISNELPDGYELIVNE